MAPGPSRASRSWAAARIASRLRAARGSVAGDVTPFSLRDNLTHSRGGGIVFLVRHNVSKIRTSGGLGGSPGSREPEERPVMAAKLYPPAPAGAHETRGAARRWWVLAVASVAQLMVVLDVTVVNIALPSAQRALAFTDADRQWVVTAYALAFDSLLLLGGKLSDRFGGNPPSIPGRAGDRHRDLRRQLRPRPRVRDLRRGRRDRRRSRPAARRAADRIPQLALDAVRQPGLRRHRADRGGGVPAPRGPASAPAHARPARHRPGLRRAVPARVRAVPGPGRRVAHAHLLAVPDRRSRPARRVRRLAGPGRRATAAAAGARRTRPRRLDHR